jgi:hypothetical protein
MLASLLSAAVSWPHIAAADAVTNVLTKRSRCAAGGLATLPPPWTRDTPSRARKDPLRKDIWPKKERLTTG